MDTATDTPETGPDAIAVFEKYLNGPEEKPKEETEEPTADEPKVEGADVEDKPAEEAPEEKPKEEEAAAVEEFDPGQLIEVTIDGQKEKVPLAELAKGYSRQSDYSKKTQELAEQRQAIEQERQYIARQSQQYADKLGEIIGAMQQSAQQQDLSPEQWRQLEEDDPGQYALLQVKRMERQKQIENAQAERSALEQQALQIAVAERQEQLKTNHQYLETRIPEWKDPKSRSAVDSEMTEYLGNLGYKPHEIQSVADGRAVLLAYKAMKYDQISGNKTIAAKKVATAPKLLKPNASRDSAAVKAEQRQSDFKRAVKDGDATEVFRKYFS